MEKEFRNCYSEDCYDCPMFEECHLSDQYDDGDNWDMELQEQQDFAQDDYPCGYEDDIMGFDEY